MLETFATVQELVGSLRAQRGDYERESAILAGLLRETRADPLAGRVVLQALLPGLKRLAGRLLFEAGEREELWSLLLAHLWAGIRSYPVERRPRRVAANLLLDAAHATLADLGKERRLRAQAPELAPASVEAGEQQEEVVLARAVRAGALSRAEALLILRSRVEGVSLVRIAAEEGAGYDALRIRRRRAELRLRLFLGSPDVRFERRNRPLSRARASGGGIAGSAGGGAVTHPKQRR
ncbi:MAG TPA: hypothetical protein VFL61_01745 [Gaiellaceae bacterium]|nr:hypothetical protein [Gaiellaceae bacterium]